jgi:hypothetical protein
MQQKDEAFVQLLTLANVYQVNELLQNMVNYYKPHLYRKFVFR